MLLLPDICTVLIYYLDYHSFLEIRKTCSYYRKYFPMSRIVDTVRLNFKYRLRTYPILSTQDLLNITKNVYLQHSGKIHAISLHKSDIILTISLKDNEQRNLFISHILRIATGVNESSSFDITTKILVVIYNGKKTWQTYANYKTKVIDTIKRIVDDKHIDLHKVYNFRIELDGFKLRGDRNILPVFILSDWKRCERKI